jgi:DNA-binding MarR family transcriptional regulator
MGASLGAERKATRPGRVSSHTLDRSFGYHLRQLAESWKESMHRRVDEHAINQAQWRYLRELWEQDGLTQKELGERVGRQGPTVIPALRSLEAAGLIRIEQNDADRRKTRVCLTPQGRRKWEALAPLVGVVEEGALAGLTPQEVKTFGRLIVRIQRNLDRANHNRNAWALSRTDKLAEMLGE